VGTVTEPLAFLDLFLFVVLPYAALPIAIVGTFERYRRHAFSCTSHSSQFLENRQHFWGSVPFHYGILAILIGHVIVIVAPGPMLAWNSAPRRLLAAETAALVFALLAFAGLAALGVRRLAVDRLRVVTGRFDWIVYALLLVQIGSGIALAMSSRWGSSWFASTLTPYLWSLLRLEPDAGAVAAMPLLVKAHIVSAFVLVALFPFSRLVHIIAVPNPYLWRRPQVVRWHRRPAAPIGGRP
jgi:nitrate reductase gamma subunit